MHSSPLTNSLQPQPSYRFGTFELLTESGELFRQGQRVKIQEQPLRLLIALLERPGEVVLRETLSQRLWPGHTFVEFDQSLGAAVMKLRQALRDDADNPRFIETIPRRGFRFLAPVVRSGAVPGKDIDETGAIREAAGVQLKEQQLRGWLTLFLGFAFVVAILLAGLWLYFLPLAPPKILGSSQVTHDGINKDGLLTDGLRLTW